MYFCISRETVLMHVMFFCVPEVTWWGRTQCEALWPNHIHGKVILFWLKESLKLFTRRLSSWSSRGWADCSQTLSLWLVGHISRGKNFANRSIFIKKWLHITWLAWLKKQTKNLNITFYIVACCRSVARGHIEALCPCQWSQTLWLFGTPIKPENKQVTLTKPA